MHRTNLKNQVINTLQNIKARDIKSIKINQLADYMLIATGSSTTHIKAIADFLVKTVKQQFQQPVTIEGEVNSGWLLLDLGEVIVHIMMASTRNFYKLESLWSIEYKDTECQQKTSCLG